MFFKCSKFKKNKQNKYYSVDHTLFVNLLFLTLADALALLVESEGSASAAAAAAKEALEALEVAEEAFVVAMLMAVMMLMMMWMVGALAWLGRRAVVVVERAALGIAEYLVGLVDLHEAFVRLGRLVLVRMPVLGESAIGVAYLLVVGVACHVEHLVRIEVAAAGIDE